MKSSVLWCKVILCITLIIFLGLSFTSCGSQKNITPLRTNIPSFLTLLLLAFIIILDLLILFYLYYVYSPINSELESIKRLVLDKLKTQTVNQSDHLIREVSSSKEDIKREKLEFDKLVQLQKLFSEKLEIIKNDVRNLGNNQQNLIDIQTNLEEALDNLNRKEEFDESDYLLDLHFRDVSQSVRRAYLVAVKQDPRFKTSIEQFIKDVSSLFMFTELSLNITKMEMAYQILRKKFEGTEVRLITPIPGEMFDENTMIVEKRFSHNDKIHTVLWPGAVIGDQITKALVHVGL